MISVLKLVYNIENGIFEKTVHLYSSIQKFQLQRCKYVENYIHAYKENKKERLCYVKNQ